MSLENDIQGHWIRDWIKAPSFEDHTTRVHWAQVGLDYADVRIPRDRPDLSNVSALDALSADDLIKLAQAEGFAGHVTLRGDQCTWHREINLHGTPDAPDVGEISFDAEGRMVETGVHAEYTELWERRLGSDPKAIRFSSVMYAGLLVTIGEMSVIGIGRRNKPSTKPLIEALRTGRVPDGIGVLFDGLHAVGRQSGGSVVADLATQPFAEGCPILSVMDSHIVWHRVGFDGTRSDIVLEIETLTI
ncbi:hypothetical protein [Tateyamaria pelophila]|uniref:hypothetical protein n=1 Tax=Tateyamaria pelophila TaxID=328415 RepID=UPI001CBAB586|nr:hypothetical protein [Tateyamaria pelophila]